MMASTARILRSAAAAIALLALAGCAQTGQPELPSLERSTARERAFVALPIGGPEVLDVVERRYPNATEQRLILANRSAVAGSNFMLVQFFGPVGNTGSGRTPLANPQIGSADISGEIRASLPGVAMARSPLYVQNRYGPFSYATGRAPNGETCIYAWQRVDGADTRTLIARARGTIQIRLRLCGGQGEHRLLAAMYGFSIRAFFGDIQWNPYGSPRYADPRLGVLNEPIYPVGTPTAVSPAVLEPTPEPAAAPVRRQATRAPRRAALVQPAAQPPVLPAPIGPTVPPPPPLANAAPAAGAPATAAVQGALSAPQPAGTPVVVPPPPPGTGAAGACSQTERQAGRC